jgi:hypothetical protein
MREPANSPFRNVVATYNHVGESGVERRERTDVTTANRTKMLRHDLYLLISFCIVVSF